MAYYMLKGLGAELCGMHGMKGMHGMRGMHSFGAGADCVNVPYVDKSGKEGEGGICPQAGCGDAKALQQALNDLGFGPITVDGYPGTQTYGALAKMAATYGVPYTGSGMDAAVCRVVGDAWLAHYKGEAYPPVTSAAAPSTTITGSKLTLIKRTPILVSALRKMGTSTTREGDVNAGPGSDGGSSGMLTAFWGNLGAPAKVGVVAGGVAVVGLLIYALTAKPGRQVEMQVMKANKKGRMSRARYFLASGKEISSEEYNDVLKSGSYVYVRRSGEWWACHLSPIAWRLGSGPSRRRTKMSSRDIPEKVKKAFDRDWKMKANKRVSHRIKRAKSHLAKYDAIYIRTINNILDNTANNIGAASQNWKKVLGDIIRDYPAGSSIGKNARATKRRVVAAFNHSFKMNVSLPFVGNPAPALRVKIAGKSWGHGTPPKKYRKLGFTRREHYAWPWGYQYPIGNAKHVRLAAGRFGKHARRYPPLVRQLIAARIDKAKKYYGIGPYRGMVTPHKGKHAFAIRGRKPSVRRVQRFRGRKAA